MFVIQYQNPGHSRITSDGLKTNLEIVTKLLDDFRSRKPISLPHGWKIQWIESQTFEDGSGI